jgi:ubiquinone/menaquinone biosynthesis C-methylase UbiE
MYTKSAAYYDQLYQFMNYADTAAQVRERILEQAPAARTLLDVGCGTGQHLEHLSRTFEAEGLDLNPDLLRLARERCPGIRFHQADMAAFALPARFDVIACLFSSIGYVRTLENLRTTLVNFARHLSPGGLVLVEPWFTPESFWSDTLTTNVADQGEPKVVWMYTSRREDRVAVLDIHYLVGQRSGVEHFTERHELGLFTHEEYLAAFRNAGLEPEHEPVGVFRRGLYLGRSVPKP